MKYTIPAFILSLFLSCGVASAQVIIVNEDFEGYATTADMQANWGAAGLGTLDTAFGDPGQSAAHPGGAVNTWIGSAISVQPSPTEFVRLSFDMYDDGLSANKRMSVGLRGGPFPLLELGMYNNPTHYAFRATGFPLGPDWVSLSNVAVQGWHRFTADLYVDHTVITLDLQGDGSVEFTSAFDVGATYAPFTDLRFGGVSGFSSAGGGANFDNILLELVPVPEPTSLALFGVGALALLRLRKTR